VYPVGELRCIVFRHTHHPGDDANGYVLGVLRRRIDDVAPLKTRDVGIRDRNRGLLPLLDLRASEQRQQHLSELGVERRVCRERRSRKGLTVESGQ